MELAMQTNEARRKIKKQLALIKAKMIHGKRAYFVNTSGDSDRNLKEERLLITSRCFP
jgi:hypothetical protein|tara:strand:+ start:303 stop:476 length:174 start_codon:yes stop_codon:yes gene_type:complete